MTDKNRPAEPADENEDLDLYDPYQVHFVSQSKRNEFLKALEDDRESFSHSTVH